jgi:hypothetical protein
VHRRQVPALKQCMSAATIVLDVTFDVNYIFFCLPFHHPLPPWNFSRVVVHPCTKLHTLPSNPRPPFDFCSVSEKHFVLFDARRASHRTRTHPHGVIRSSGGVLRNATACTGSGGPPESANRSFRAKKSQENIIHYPIFGRGVCLPTAQHQYVLRLTVL